MRILPYYLVHSFIGAVKKLFKSTTAIIIVFILICGIFGGIIGFGAGVFFGDDTSDSSQTEIDEQLEEGLEEIDFENMLVALEVGIGGIALLMILINIYTANKSGAAIFKMPDVNILFAAPLRPQSILLFRTILQMGVSIISSVYILFQIPSIASAFNLNLGGCFALFFTWIMILFISQLASVCTYTITATHEKLRKFIHPFVIGVVVIIAASYYGYAKLSGKGYLDAAASMFASRYGRFIPVFGWLQGMVMSIIEGSYLNFFLYFLALFALCAVFIYIIWHIKADFYEDAFSMASTAQEALENAKATTTVKRKKDRNEKIARNRDIGGQGASVFFTKTLYNRRRFSKLGFLSTTAITYTLISIIMIVSCLFLFETTSLIPLGLILTLFVYFRNLGSPIANESATNFLFLVPESPFKKLYYTIAGGLLETLLDLLPSAVLASVFLKQNPLILLLLLIVWVSLDLYSSATGALIDLFLPSSVVPQIKAMLQLILRMLSVLPGIILIIIFAVLSKLFIGLILYVLLNSALSAAFLAISPRLLHTGKK